MGEIGSTGHLRRYVLSAAGLCAFFSAWASAASFSQQTLLPGPTEVARVFMLLLFEPFAGSTLLKHLASSLLRFFGGFSLAVFIGVPLGLCAGWSRRFDAIFTPLFESVRFVSPIAWVAFAALWFGTGVGGPLLIIFAGAFPPCVINAYRGPRFVDERLVEAARTLGAGRMRVVFQVLLPASFPSIVAGLRVAAGMGWQSLVGAELIVASSGIGYLMVQAQSGVKTAIVMAGMAAIGLVGFSLDLALRRAERMFVSRTRK
jgi:ABC-type nitrate/sulfonate/bicarbonate transport system permease component